MARTKRPRGRPPEHKLPPIIDASAEDVARAVLGGGKLPDMTIEVPYACTQCGRTLEHPDIQFDDGRCEDCHG